MGLLGSLVGAPGPAFSAWTVGTPIVTYYGGPGRDIPQTDVTAAQLAEGGWNLVWARTQAELTAAQAHGLRAMWTGPLDDATVESIRDNPALYSYYVVDEPNASQFADLAATVSRLRALDPDHVAYLNLFPNYATPEQLGISGSSEPYVEHLKRYMSTVHPSLLSYDHYQFNVGSDLPYYFQNLAIISHAAKQAGVPFVNIVQACSWYTWVRVPTGNELRFLYTTSLAYGAQGISQFVYYGANVLPEGGGMALVDGTTTTLYDTAKTLNREFVAIAKEVQSMRHIGAYHLGDLPWGSGATDGSSPLRLPGTSPFTISGISDTDYKQNAPVRGAVLGLWGPNDLLADATRALVVNLDYSSALDTRVTGPGDLSVFDPATGKWNLQAHAWADVRLLPGGGVLVGLTSAADRVPAPASTEFQNPQFILHP